MMADDDFLPDEDFTPAGPPVSWSRAVTDIPGDIAKGVGEELGALREGFMPEGGKASQGVIEGQLKTGRALMAIPGALYRAVAPLVTTPTGVAGAKATEYIGSLINPSAQPDYEKMLKESKEAADTALGAAAPAGRMVRTPAGLDFQRPPAPAAPTPPASTGVTLSEGELTGDLAARQREVAALRGQSGKPAQQKAEEFFVEQRGQQMTAEQERIAREMDPARSLIAEEPYTSGQIIQAEVGAREAARGQDLFDLGQTLQRTQEDLRLGMHPNRQVLAQTPHEAAEIAQGGITRAREIAEASRDAAYDTMRATEGDFSPKYFANIGEKARRSFVAGDDPFLLNSKTTPVTMAAIEDLEAQLGATAAHAADPATKSHRPFTVEYIDNIKKRLNAFRRQAASTANATGDRSDIAGMSRLIDFFDDRVSRGLRLKNMFSGDGRAAADALDQARGLHASLRQTFSRQGQGDVVGPVIEKILGQRAGQALNPEQVAQALYGSANSDKVAARMEQIFGANSPEWSALRQGLVSHIIERPQGVGAFEPEQLARRIGEFTDGRFRFLTERYLAPQEIAQLRRHADAVRNYSQATRAPEGVERLYRSLADLPPNEIVSRMFGSGVPIDRASRVQVLTRLRDEMGVSSPQWSGVKQGLFSKAIEPTAGLKDWGPGRVANNLDKLLDSDIARIVYTPDDIRALRAFSDLNRTIEVPQAAGNWSGTTTGVRSHLRKITALIGGAIATAIAHGVGIPFGAAEASGFGTAYMAGKISDRLSARTVARQLPLIKNQMAAYQKALARHQRAATGTTRMQLTGATNTLSQSLARMGIPWADLQGLKTVPADEQHEERPGRRDDQPDGDRDTELQNRASGGAIKPPMKGALRAPDGNWYVPDSSRKGKYLRVDAHG